MVRASLLLLLASPIYGQGVLTGVVKDQAGGLIPNAAASLTNLNSGLALQSISNDAGIFSFAALPPGKYGLKVTSTGFDPFSTSTLELALGQTLSLDVTLSVTAQSASVNVEANVPLTETQTSDLTQVITQKQVATLPLPNRAATTLVALAPGVVMIDSGSSAENYPVFSVAGGRARNQNFTLDGGNVTNAVGLTRPQQMTSLPVDAMQEFRVITNNYSAEHGHSTGGVIELSTRSGTNDLHGSVFEFVRNSAFDARNFFSAQQPPLRMHQFGASAGGPIIRDKTHFFAAWEQTRETVSYPVLQTVPTLAQRNGDFSGGPLIYDPATTSGRDRSPFPNNRIPASRFDPVALAALNYYPLPNLPGSSTGANNFLANSDQSLHRDIVAAKVDHQFRPADSVSARYYLNNSNTSIPGSWSNPVADPNGDRTDARIQSVLGRYTHIFKADLLNDLRLSYLRRKFIDQRYGLGDGYAQKIGLTGVSAAAFPNFNVNGFASLGGNGAVSRFQTPIEDTQVLDAVSWFRGKHAGKFGGEYRRGFNNESRDRSSSGSFTFNSLITSKPGASNTGNSLASFLLGLVNAANVQVSDVIPSHASYLAFYAQDDWRVTSKLTLNYGLRWEAEQPRYVSGDRQNSFDPLAINPVSGTPGIVTFSGRNGVPRRAFATRLNNFAPRLGFAWSIREHTVIRGGSGIFYGPTVSNSVGDAAALGFSTSSSLVVAQADTSVAMHLRDGYPVITRPSLNASFGAVPLGQRPNTAVTFWNPSQPTPISYQYNLNVQHEMRGSLVTEIGYLANVSHHLTANDLSLNQVRPELMGPGDAQSRRPFPQFSNVSWINPAIGNSTYHAAFVKAEKRFSHGYSLLAHYTFSKFLDDVASGTDYGDPASYMDAYNRRLDKGRSGSDVPHRLVLSGLYEVPSFHGNRLLHPVAGSWKLGAMATLQSGAVFTVVQSANLTNAFPAGAVRPDLIADPAVGTQTLAHWFNTAAFAAPDAFRFGNSPRSVLRGASQKTVDATLEKEFAVTERYRFSLRGEAFNLLNHANFDVPGHTLGEADFGVVSSARPARVMQVGLRLGW